jgi:hypothetical protein
MSDELYFQHAEILLDPTAVAIIVHAATLHSLMRDVPTKKIEVILLLVINTQGF